MTMSDDKYIVFKRETFETLLVEMSSSINPITGAALNNFVSAAVEDAVVIRRQDFAAPHILEAYATFYSATAEILKEHGEGATAARLIKVADYFHQQALLSWDHPNRKIPD